MNERDPVLRVTIVGGAVDDADEGANHLAELILGKGSGSTSHFRAWNGIEVELGDNAEVIPAASKSPVEVRIGICTGCDNGTARSNNLFSVSFLNKRLNTWLSYLEALDVIASPAV
jgi:hypothetical protein